MKHAFLIVAYKHASLLAQLVKQLDHRKSSFFIHIDSKSDLVEDPAVNALRASPNVWFSSNRIAMHWAGFSHVSATIQLLHEALRNPEITYCHLLSGQCFPIRSTESLLEFFEANNHRNFIDYFAIPDSRWGKSGGWDRLLHYHLYDVLNPRGKQFDVLNRKFVGLQRLLKLRRPYPNSFPRLYGGGTWWSLHRDFIEYFLEYVGKNPYFLRRFQHSFCPDEFLFQTVLLNSPYKDTAVNNNLRFVDWSKRGKSPPNLDESYFEQMMKGNHLFARKFAPGSSDVLLEMIHARIFGRGARPDASSWNAVR